MAVTGTVRSSFAGITQVVSAMHKKIADSVLTTKDAKTLGFEALTAEDVARKLKLPVHRAGFRIPYFGLNGKPSKFYRFRYLEYGEAEGGFRALVATTAKQLRYVQPGDSLNELYLPPLIDWKTYAQDPTRPLLITEGELKAACATKHGYACIGLGGVWCFKSAKQALPLLPQFNDFAWSSRPVFICYDSDAVTNPLVIQAENALARALLKLGADPLVARIPQTKDSKKCGLDDYILAHGSDSFKTNVLDKAEQWKAAEELFKLNEEVLYVKDPGLVLELNSLQRMSPRAFIEHVYAPRVYWEQQIQGNSTKLVEKSAAREWVKWPHRAVVKRVTYAPGLERITDGELNCWHGWGVDPKAGEVAPWRELLDYLFKNGTSSARQWFEQWLAYPLQYPGSKLYSACVLWGIHHGTGKSMVGYTMGRIYGRNFVEIGDRDLYASFNDWAEHKQFVLGEEITGGDKRATADRMKSLITQKQLRVNTKFVPVYTIPDCINYYFTSNHPDAFFLEDSDRRFFIHEVSGQPLPDSFYRSYMQWLDADGASYLFDYLLNLDIRTFNPQGHAFTTASKREMIEDGRSEIGAWVAALKEDPDRILAVGDASLPYKLWTTAELHQLFDPQDKSRVTLSGLGRELRRGGFVRAMNGTTIKTQSAGYQRLWVIRKVDATKAVQFAGIFDKERGDKKGRKF